MPWPVAMFSIVATETSVLTFISVPGLAYRGDWFFLQLAFGDGTPKKAFFTALVVGSILTCLWLYDRKSIS